MRIFKPVLILLICVGWVVLLNRPMGSVPAIGKLMDPLKGFWSNAVNEKKAVHTIVLPQKDLKQPVKIYLDERLVPHITATTDEDLYYAQGFLHAYYRLWQMDMQARAAAGRISEVAGEKAFGYDRNQRRKGMVWAAENSLKAMEAEPHTKAILDAYTKGVNAFISGLEYKDYPLEYKLMGFKPERWNNLKCALLLKYMADDLTGSVDDIAMSYLREKYSKGELDYLFPEKIAGGIPVIPAGTDFQSPSLRTPPVPPGEVFARFNDTASSEQKKMADLIFRRAGESGIGSNNWALNGSRTVNGSAILCNDPHLGLNLPAIWYEIQLTAPGINCYGASIPGAPGIIIGFNDSISWGVTNNYRDVKDYYEIISEDPRFYFFDKKEVPFNQRVEKIYIKGKKDPFNDTIRFTIHGPVQYDHNFPEPSGSGKMLAMTWMAHRGTNELLSIYFLNRARNYDEFVRAIQYFECPAQNFIYADKLNNIALWGQGRFINKWKDQGKFVMRGDTHATLWGDTIPMSENPHVLNPPQNYLVSANQQVTDNTYPYWYNGDFSEFRSWDIHYFLNDTNKADINTMQVLQNSNWSYAAMKLYPLFSGYLSTLPENISALFRNWNYSLDAQSKAAGFFQVWSYFLQRDIWADEFGDSALLYPSPEVTVQLVTTDTVSRFLDNIRTPGKETLSAVITQSMKKAADSFSLLEKRHGSEWYKMKNTTVAHLAKIKAFSYEGLLTGGWGNTINAMKQNHGPSWRMIVEPGNKMRARVIYPGGQSGNPGSRYYADFLESWTKGKYYEVNFLPAINDQQ